MYTFSPPPYADPCNLGRSLMCILVPFMISFRSTRPPYAWWYSFIRLRIMGWTWDKSHICLMWTSSSVGGCRALGRCLGGCGVDLLSFLALLLVADVVGFLSSLFILQVLPSIFPYQPSLPCTTILLLISSRACFSSIFLPWSHLRSFPFACRSSSFWYHSLVSH